MTNHLPGVETAVRLKEWSLRETRIGSVLEWDRYYVRRCMEPGGGFVRPLSVDAVIDHGTGRVRPSDFEGFYRVSWLAVYRPLAATLGEVDLAAEATDEAMTRAFARWSTVRNAANVEGWVYRVAFRWAIDRRRRQRRLRALLPRLGSDHQDGEHLVEPGLEMALEVLPIGQRAVVVLACAFDWSESEIADALSIRPGTVKSRLHRGLTRLREEMGA